jgi:DNA-binding transcriptional regulator YhcF (GntR family)
LLRKSDELSGACRNYFEQLKQYIIENEQSTFTNRLMGQAFRISHSTIKRYHFELNNAGLIKINQDKKTKTYWYEVTSTQEYEALKKRISSVLDEVLEKIKQQEGNKKQPIGSNRLSKENEPTKPNNSSGKKQRLSKNGKDTADQKNVLSETKGLNNEIGK